MAEATISISIDENLKHDFEELCENIGMSVSTAFTVFMMQSVRESRLPVSLFVDPFQTCSMKELLQHSHELKLESVAKRVAELLTMQEGESYPVRESERAVRWIMDVRRKTVEKPVAMAEE